MSNDAKDILFGLAQPAQTKEPKRSKKRKRPDGMSNEVFGLLGFSSRDPVTLVPTQASNGGYKERPKLWGKQCREWTLKVSPSRSDGLKLKHWAAADQEISKIADFNLNKISIPRTQANKVDGTWGSEETLYMLDLCERFDCRFIVVADRYDWKHEGKMVDRKVEDIKERYYQVTDHTICVKDDIKSTYVYDADHERRRKEQLDIFYKRSRKEAEDADKLVEERKRIEQKRKLKDAKDKKEAEKKSKKMATVIPVPTATNTTTTTTTPKGRTSPPTVDDDDEVSPGTSAILQNNKPPDFGLKFPELKQGICLRSSQMILPTSATRKKRNEIIDKALGELDVQPHPIPTEKVTADFNNLRSDILKLHDMRSAYQHCEVELFALIKQFEDMCPGTSLPNGVESIESLKRRLSSPTNTPSKKSKL